MVVVVIVVFQDRVSLYSFGCAGIRSVDQAGLKLRDLPASASQVLGLKACTPCPIESQSLCTSYAAANWYKANYPL